ncbi:MAG: tetratricopeptide repeat protein [Bacteroidales bacterium]|nr:tetratricopeptide repeat protein [Bacteroidales bacterium]
MSENREQVFENEEFQVLLRKYEDMRSGSQSIFFDVEEFEQIIDYYLDDFQYDEAREAADIGKKQHPASVEIKYKFIHIYIEQGQPKKALALLEDIPVWEENNPERYFLKGTALCLTGKLKEAEAQFDRGLELSGDDTFEALINISIAFENVRHFEQAIKYLIQAYRQYPENLSVLYDLGYFYDRLHRFDESLKYYQLYLDLDPYSDNVWYNMGIVYHKLEQFEKAVEAYDFSIVINPDYASAYFNKASVWVNAGNFDRAIDTYKEFLEVESESTQAYCYMGDCYEQMNRLDDALDAFKKVIELDNSDPEGWFGAGMIYHRLGSQQEAITYILKAIEFDNNNLDYWLNLGYANEDAGLIEEAVKCYGYVTRADANDLDGWLALTGLLMKEGHYKKAIDFLREAFIHHAADAGIKIKMAVCHLKMGKKELSVKFLEEALAANSDLDSEFGYYFPEGKRDADIESIIQQFKK